jgi:hypothetical protein
MSSWNLDEDSKDGILNLIELIHKNFLVLADKSNKVIAVGEVLYGLEVMISDDDYEVEYNTELTVGRKVRFNNEEEGIFYSLRVNEFGLSLDKLITTYSSSVGSDWGSESYLQAPVGHANFSSKIQNWLADVLEIINFDDIYMTVSRDHL